MSDETPFFAIGNDEAESEEVVEAIDHVRAALAISEARAARLAAALRLVEWGGDWCRICPGCEADATDGHAADCAVGRALAGETT